jgi:hypothetical protein
VALEIPYGLNAVDLKWIKNMQKQDVTIAGAGF